MTNRYRESASLKLRGRRGGVGDSASCGSFEKNQNHSGSGHPRFFCLGYGPRHNKAFVPTPRDGAAFPGVSWRRGTTLR
jgi:hypothetical protein